MTDPRTGWEDPLALRYEALRSAYLEGGVAALEGVALLVRHGVSAWIRAAHAQEVDASEPARTPAVTRALCLGDADARVVSVLSAMVAAHLGMEVDDA